MKNVRKVIAMVLVLALTVAMSVAGTIAYLTDTDAATNVFTTGKVQIDLTEAVVEKDEDDNLVAKADGSRNDVLTNELAKYDYGKIYPGQTIFKDPTIELLEGSEDAYIAAVITVTDGEGDIEKLIGTGYEGLLGINKMVSGGFVKENDTMKTDHPLYGKLPVYGDTTYSVYQEVVNEDTYKFYIFVEGVKSAGFKATLFDTITIDADWGNEEMAELAELTITVDAYAVQAHGFENCYEAMTTAFAAEFDF